MLLNVDQTEVLTASRQMSLDSLLRCRCRDINGTSAIGNRTLVTKSSDWDGWNEGREKLKRTRDVLSIRICIILILLILNHQDLGSDRF